MLVPRYVTMVFFSGAKGGTGKSTIASNAAIALSTALKSYVTLIDLGVDSTQTSSKILGINPDRPGILDYLINGNPEPEQLLVRSSVAPSVYVIPPGRLKTWELGISASPTNTIINRFELLLNQAAIKTGSTAIIIDLPAHSNNLVTVVGLWHSKIINIVMDAALYADSILEEIDNYYIQPLFSVKTRIVNVLINKAVPGLDVLESKAKAFVRNGELIILPMSPALHYLTSTLKPFVFYKTNSKTLKSFEKQFNQFIDILKTQIYSVLSG